VIVARGRRSDARSSAAVGLAALVLLAAGLLILGSPGRAGAVNLTQAEVAMPLLTADPHQGAGAGDGVIDGDVKEPTESSGSNNVILLIAALGALIGILIVTRPRRGPKS
jgi:hypothetical protein